MADERETVAALSATPAFADLPPVELAKLVSAVETRSYRVGQVIAPPGEAWDGLYIVRSGLVEIVIRGRDGLPHPVGMLGPTDSYGELNLVSDTPAGTSLVVLRDTELLVLPRDRYQQLASRNPDLAIKLGANLARRLQERNRRIADLSAALAEVSGEAYRRLADDQRLAMIRADLADDIPRRAASDSTRRSRGILPGPWIGAALATIVFLAVALPAPPAGLSREGQLALALLAGSVPLMVFEVLADHLVAMLLVVGWTALNLVPGPVALSGFASATWFLVLGILGIGVAIGRTGLLYRAVLTLANRAPRTLLSQALTLAAAGLVFTPAMPNATSRMVLSAPVGLEMIDAFGLPRRGASAALVGVATLLGFGMMGTLFLTGTSSGLLVHSLLPEDVRRQFAFGTWLVAALPLHLTILAVTFAAAGWLFREAAQQRVRNELLHAQSLALGRPTRSEWLVGIVTIALIAGLIAQPWHGLNAAWLAIAGLLALGGLGIVDTSSFRTGINWSFLIFFGAITSLGEVLSTLKVDVWLGGVVSALLAPLAATPALFLVGLSLAGMATCFAIRWQAASVLLTIVLSPSAMAIGVNPWIVGIIALVSTNLWIFPYQSTIYLALYHGVDGHLFSHQQLRPIALIYAAAIPVGVLVSVPWWHWLGLIP